MNRYNRFMQERARELHENAMALRRINVRAMKAAADKRDASRLVAMHGVLGVMALAAESGLRWKAYTTMMGKDGG